MRLSRGARWAVQTALLLLVVFAVHAWQTRDLLPADRRAPAPALDLVDLNGARWTTTHLHGRPAVIYFFAPWCGVCAASAPQLRAFHRWRGDDVTLLLVGLDATGVDELQRLLDREGRAAARDFGLTTAPGLWWRTLFL